MSSHLSDDPRVLDYVYGELDADQKKRFEHDMQNDPTLAGEVHALRKVLSGATLLRQEEPSAALMRNLERMADERVARASWFAGMLQGVSLYVAQHRALVSMTALGATAAIVFLVQTKTFRNDPLSSLPSQASPSAGGPAAEVQERAARPSDEESFRLKANEVERERAEQSGDQTDEMRALQLEARERSARSGASADAKQPRAMRTSPSGRRAAKVAQSSEAYDDDDPLRMLEGEASKSVRPRRLAKKEGNEPSAGASAAVSERTSPADRLASPSAPSTRSRPASAPTPAASPIAGGPTVAGASGKSGSESAPAGRGRAQGVGESTSGASAEQSGVDLLEDSSSQQDNAEATTRLLQLARQEAEKKECARALLLYTRAWKQQPALRSRIVREVQACKRYLDEHRADFPELYDATKK